MRVVLTVDPGVNAIGFAAWDLRRWKTGTCPLPIEVGVLRCDDEKAPWAGRVTSCVQQLWKFDQGDVETVKLFTEEPVMFGGATGLAVARRGDLTHLAASVGALAQWARGRGALFECFPVNQWIGQLPKTVMQKRVLDVLYRAHPTSVVDKLMGKPSHHYDAVGIGLYALGVWR